MCIPNLKLRSTKYVKQTKNIEKLDSGVKCENCGPEGVLSCLHKADDLQALSFPIGIKLEMWGEGQCNRQSGCKINTLGNVQGARLAGVRA